MLRTLKIAPALLVAATAFAVWSGSAGAGTTGGVVVGKLHGAVLVASPTGLVRAFAGHATVGSRVVMQRGHLVLVGRSRTAHIRGIVIRLVGATTFISSNRHVVAVHEGRSTAASTGSAPPAGNPQPGDTVSTQVSVGGNGQLDEESEDDLGPSNASSLQIQAVIKSVGAGTVTITVNGQDLTLDLPAGLTLPASVVGQTVTLDVDLNNGGDDNSGDGDGGGGQGGDGGGD